MLVRTIEEGSSMQAPILTCTVAQSSLGEEIKGRRGGPVKAMKPEMQSVATPVVIRDLDSISEIQQAEELQKEVWGFSDRDVVPSDQMMIAKEVGGLLIGAFVGQTLVGFVYALLSIERDRLQFHSHLLAVKPDFRNRGLGYELKLAQRERALARGIARITWTFDPLQCMNAHFNLTKLGVVSDRYKINFYGESTSSLLHRHGTDRLWVTWLLDSARVTRRLETGNPARPLLTELDESAHLVELGDDDAPRCHETTKLPGERHVLVEIPDDISTLELRDSGLAKAWREATRRAFTSALEAGYLVEEFYQVDRGHRRLGVYVLTLERKIDDFPKQDALPF
jgi:chorismate synthase